MFKPNLLVTLSSHVMLEWRDLTAYIVEEMASSHQEMSIITPKQKKGSQVTMPCEHNFGAVLYKLRYFFFLVDFCCEHNCSFSCLSSVL